MTATVLAIFGLVYLGMILGGLPFLQLDRTGIALLGAIAMIATEAVSVEQAARSIDLPTVLLLFAFMVVSAQMRLGGFYDWITVRLSALPVTPPALLGVLIAVVALLSAVFSNDIVCLAVAPVLVDACMRRSLDPIPFLLGLACAANIGSAATLIGNPQNMLIGQTLHMSFVGYAAEAAMPVLVGLVLTWAVIVARVGAVAACGQRADRGTAGVRGAGPGPLADRQGTARGARDPAAVPVCPLAERDCGAGRRRCAADEPAPAFEQDAGPDRLGVAGALHGPVRRERCTATHRHPGAAGGGFDSAGPSSGPPGSAVWGGFRAVQYRFQRPCGDAAAACRPPPVRGALAGLGEHLCRQPAHRWQHRQHHRRRCRGAPRGRHRLAASRPHRRTCDDGHHGRDGALPVVADGRLTPVQA